MQDDQNGTGNPKRQALPPLGQTIARQKEQEDLAAQLAREGKQLRAQLHPQGELLARVTKALDSGLANDSGVRQAGPLAGTQFAAPARRAGGLRQPLPASLEGLWLLAAALMLLVCLPHLGKLSGPQSAALAEGAQPVELTLLMASRLEQLYPAQLLQSLSTPLARLVQTEGQEIERELLRVVEGFSERLPAFPR